MVEALYKGYGKLDPQLIYQHGIMIFESKEEMEYERRISITKDEPETITGNKKMKGQDPVICLEDYRFR